jgi:sugar-specific transcriptional regulator TrmB
MNNTKASKKTNIKRVKELEEAHGMGHEFPELCEKLIKWGLNKYETSVYLYLLTRSMPTGGSKIAIGAKLHRPYVYASLPRLVELSLVIEVAHGKQSRYKAMPPAQLEKIEMKRALETAELTVALKKISKIAYEQDAELFIGREAIVRHQLEWVRNAPRGMTQYLIGGSGLKLAEIFEEDLDLNARRQAEKELITYYISSPNEAELMTDYHKNKVRLHHRFLSFIPEMMPTIVIRNDVVEIHSYFNPPIVHVIKSKDVAEKFKIFFLGLWEMAK